MDIFFTRRRNWSPARLAVAPTLWLESLDVSGVHADPIDTWTNKSGGADVTASGGARPTVDASSFAQKVVSFSGVGNVMDIPTLGFSGSFTAYVLLRRYSGSDYMWGLVPKTQAFMPLQFTDGKTYVANDTDLHSCNNPGSVGWNLCQYDWSGSGTPNYRVDTADQTLTYTATGGSSSENKLGARPSVAQYGKGYIAFVLFCAAQHTADERALVEAYVKRKFPSLVQY